MSRPNILLILTMAALAGGCTSGFESDGTAESELVRAWLESRHPEKLAEPNARLVMSDFGVPLTTGNLRRMGPDRLPGCERSTLRRQGSKVVASWTCPAGTDIAFRTVYFRVKNKRIAAANYTEAYQAVREKPDR